MNIGPSAAISKAVFSHCTKETHIWAFWGAFSQLVLIPADSSDFVEEKQNNRGPCWWLLTKWERPLLLRVSLKPDKSAYLEMVVV